MPFNLPNGGRIYSEHVVARAEDLIAHQIWQGIDVLRLKHWLNNFRSAEHRYFAARVLETLIFRSEAQTISMLTHLFHRTIPDLARRFGLPLELCSAFERLKFRIEPNFRIVPVEPSDDAVPPSGRLIAKLIQKQLRFRKEWIIRYGQVSQDTPFVVFIDDLIGTGNQFTNFLKQQNLEHLIEERRCCYVALAAHGDGIRHLKSKFPGLPLSAVDLLEAQNSLFGSDSLAFPDGTNTITDAKAFYYEMLDQFHINNSKFRDGYGGLNLAYAFAHTVPNNSTPLIWWPQNAVWTPLFDR